MFKLVEQGGALFMEEAPGFGQAQRTASLQQLYAKGLLQLADLSTQRRLSNVQLFGGAGYMTEYPIARAWADARVTRIAGGDPAIWRDIFLCNREEMLHQTDALIASLQTFAKAIADNDADTLLALITEASNARSQWRMSTMDNNFLP